MDNTRISEEYKGSSNILKFLKGDDTTINISFQKNNLSSLPTVSLPAVIQDRYDIIQNSNFGNFYFTKLDTELITCIFCIEHLADGNTPESLSIDVFEELLNSPTYNSIIEGKISSIPKDIDKNEINTYINECLSCVNECVSIFENLEVSPEERQKKLDEIATKQKEERIRNNITSLGRTGIRSVIPSEENYINDSTDTDTSVVNQDITTTNVNNQTQEEDNNLNFEYIYTPTVEEQSNSIEDSYDAPNIELN